MRSTSIALLLTFATLCVAQGPGQLPMKSYVAPVYPRAEEDAGHEGVVTLLARVRKSGRVESVELQTSCGYPALDASAVAAAMRYRFEPARDSKGKKTEGTTIIKIDFVLPPPPGGFMKQRCMDLTREVAIARGTYRDLKLTDVKTFVATTEMLSKMSTGRPPEVQRRFLEMLPRVYELTLARCSATPPALYEGVLGGAIGDAHEELKTARSGSDP